MILKKNINSNLFRYRLLILKVRFDQISLAHSLRETVFDEPAKFKNKFDYSYVPEILRSIQLKWKKDVDLLWKSRIEQQKSNSRPSKYILSMFPYPSGQLHLGHTRIYTTADLLFKTSIMLGENVINPMGFDSFGLPAENAARSNKIDPFYWTDKNRREMRSQLDNLGYHFHWRESTSDQNYYKWTQWLFIQLFESGLAYQGISEVNWDPIDCTVLADEQVDSDGKCWRSGAQIEKRFHKQWFIKTNSFAEDLYRGDDIIDTGHWSFILAHQRWWIKEPNGYLFYLKLDSENRLNNRIQIFTAYPELFLSSKAFIGVSQNHWIAKGRNPHEIIASCDNPFNNNEKIDIRVVNNNVKLPSSTRASLFVRNESFPDEEKRAMILEEARKLNLGGYKTSDTYRDWLISRQRYWGTPIPIIHCPNCGPLAVKLQELPVKLPKIDYTNISDHKSDEISSPLKKFAPKEWFEQQLLIN